MLKRTAIFFALFVCGLILLIGIAPQHVALASPQTATGTIAYVLQNHDTGDEIWSIEPNGTNNHRIYSTGVPDPYGVNYITSLAWRPDARELVFASNHEDTCSWYASDLFAIVADGSGYRRVTNSPTCAALASYPKGSVTVSVSAASSLYQTYVMGAPEPHSVSGGTVTINNVADLGDVLQPIVAIYGGYRWMGPAVNVLAGQTVDAGIMGLTEYGFDTVGAYKPAFKRDGSTVGYAFGCAGLYGVADHPPIGDWGKPLFTSDAASPCVMAWGSTPDTADKIVYFSDTGNAGIYRTTQNGDAGDQLISSQSYDNVFGIQYLPDASGIVYSMTDSGASSNLYRYDFATDTITPLTNFEDEYARDFALSPDGKQIVFERASDPIQSYGGASDLWIMSTDGSFPMRLFVANGEHPTWSPQAVPAQLSYKLYLPLTLR